MTVFTDTSAIIKLYIPESGASAVRGLSKIVISQLARVEVPAAFWLKHRIGGIAALDAALLIAVFEIDYYGEGLTPPRFNVVDITSQILEEASRRRPELLPQKGSA